MKVLIITHAYAPDAAPRAFRWTAIAEYWAREGATVHVITTGRRGGATIEQRDGVTVHHVGETFVGRLYRGAGIAGAAASRDGRPMRNRQSILRGLLRRTYDATWRRIFWPDYACLWYRPALALAKRLCRTSQFDAVITVSHPFTGHVIGLSLKRQIPAVRWLADIGDPFSLDDTVASNNQALYRRLNRRMEAEVLRECDAVSVTVAGCADVLAEAFAADLAKFRVIPPLLSLPDASSTGGRPGFAGRDTLDLVYLGVLYPTLRPPDSLLALFAAMHARHNALRLHFFGDIQGCEPAFARHRDLLGTTIRVHGPISRGEVASTMEMADVLVNIGNGTAHQLPSKLVEYIAAGKPILNIARSGRDTAAEFLRDHPAALSVTLEDNTPRADQIDRALGFVRRRPAVSPAERDRLVAQFHLSAVAGAFARLVSDGAPGTAPIADRHAHRKAAGAQ